MVSRHNARLYIRLSGNLAQQHTCRRGNPFHIERPSPGGWIRPFPMLQQSGVDLSNLWLQQFGLKMRHSLRLNNHTAPTLGKRPQTLGIAVNPDAVGRNVRHFVHHDQMLTIARRLQEWELALYTQRFDVQST
jgi:hypothetical protein